MRKLWSFILALALFAGLAVAVQATSATISNVTSVASDGTCNVSVTVVISIDRSEGTVFFPVPGNAYHVTLNGNRVRTSRDGQIQNIDLSGVLGGMTGQFSFTVNYSVGGTVAQTEEGIRQLKVPLLSGFAYGVSQLHFSVTLPGLFETLPAFSSGYHQASIERDLQYEIAGPTITGSSLKALKDHEALEMTLVVTEELFPNVRAEVVSTAADDIGIGVCILVALLYWLVFLRGRPSFRGTSAEAPEGFGAGEVGTLLSMRGGDLTMMVLSWAQLGYVYVQLDRRDRVTVYRRMDMGNERSSFEQRIFRDLFRSRDAVDTTSLFYAKLQQSVAASAPAAQHLLHKRNGSIRIFRLLAAVAGLFGGVSLGIAISTGAAVQGLWIFLMAVLGGLLGWYITGWGESLYYWNKIKSVTALAATGVWVIFSLLAGEFSVALTVLCWLWLSGLLAALGGRRTVMGRLLRNETLGLRRHLKNISREEVQRICALNPEYYFAMAPYALALDVDVAFSKRFGKDRLPECPYLQAPQKGGLNAFQWNQILRRVVQNMDRRGRFLKLEKYWAVGGCRRQKPGNKQS